MVREFYWSAVPHRMIGVASDEFFHPSWSMDHIRESCLKEASEPVAIDNNGKVYTGDDLWRALGEYRWS